VVQPANPRKHIIETNNIFSAEHWFGLFKNATSSIKHSS